MNTHITFKGKRYPFMQQHIIQIIKDLAKKIRVNDELYRMIGTLLIEEIGQANVDTVNVTIDLGQPKTTIAPTTATSTG